MPIVILLVALLAGSPVTQSEETPSTLPSRPIVGIAQPSASPLMPTRSGPVLRISLTVGGFLGDSPSYHAYPLPLPSARSEGASGGISLDFGRLFLAADTEFRLKSRGWWVDTSGRIRLFGGESLSINLAASGTFCEYSDMLYRGTAGIDLGMERNMERLMIGASLRRGTADAPSLELVALFGRSRIQQQPELWVDSALVHATRPLPQIERNPVASVRLRGAHRIVARVALVADIGYTDWLQMQSLIPDRALDVRGGMRLAAKSWCSTSLLARWSSENRGPNPYKTSLMLSITIRKQ